MKNLTTDDVAQALSVDRATAYKLVSFLSEAGVIKSVGVKREEGKRGKGATVFSFEDDIAQKLSSIGQTIMK